MFTKQCRGLRLPQARPRRALLLGGLMAALAAVLFSGELTSSAQAQPPAPSKLSEVQPPRPRVRRPLAWVSRRLNPGVLSSLNPQPLPPRAVQTIGRVNPGVLSSLNPQPLPPRVTNSGFNRSFFGR